MSLNNKVIYRLSGAKSYQAAKSQKRLFLILKSLNSYI